MSKKRRIRIHGVRHKEPDLRKLSRALIELAAAQAETDAAVTHEANKQPEQPTTKPSAEASP